MSRLPLDLYAEVQAADGTRYKWDANQAPGSRLRNFSFRTKIGEGFSDANGQLARRIDLDYPDLRLVNTVTIVGADGSVAYEGRLAAMPRELSDTHSIGVTLAGWMAHAKDRKFTEIYIDRDLSAWGPPSRGRRAVLFPGNWTPHDPSQVADPTDSKSGIRTSFTGAWASPAKPISEAWYDAGSGVLISRVQYEWEREPAGGVGTGPPWEWYVGVSADDKASSGETSGNLRAAGPGQAAFVPVTPRRYAYLQLNYNSTPAGADGVENGLSWYHLAVYGNHGLLRRPIAGEPDGFYASDIIRDVASRFCPQLDVTGVQDSSYAIAHCAFKEQTFPYDAFLEVNKYHLWHLGVWENKRLDFRPYDLTDYDWEIRTDDPGTTFSPQGPSTENLFNGIVVIYTDLLTGITQIVTPDDDATLADTSSVNPWNQHGINHWDEIRLSTPTLEVQAIQTGQAALTDRNRPKTPGTITVRGYIRDRAGKEQPVWKVRAGDTISITNFPNDTPRLIVETEYNDEDKTLRIAVDRPFQLLEAYLDRVGNALSARGLT